MASRHGNHSKRTGYFAKALVILGLTALAADLALIAQPVERLAESLHDGFLTLVPTLGLSFLNAARAVAFHQVDYFSLVSRILVLFTAMLSVIAGVALLHTRPANVVASDHLNASAFGNRETENG